MSRFKSKNVATTSVRVIRPRRNIDKILKVVKKTGFTTQTGTVLATATFPCTITGLRWNLAFSGEATNLSIHHWAIIIVRDGNAANTIATSDAADFYQPEQNVLAFGVGMMAGLSAAAGPFTIPYIGSTKTMRKLLLGDRIDFIVVANQATNLNGIVQMFCKV